MLEEKGELSASDSIRKHIPELPSFADSIKIANLLYHTSGLIDWFDLMILAGWNERDVITADQVFKILSHQKEPLFEPGSKYLYTRTDYTLLAEIVKRISGQPFREWTWTNIFKPLKMTRTLFLDDHREIIENRAHAINYSNYEGYLRGTCNLEVVGSTSLFTTQDDFIKWMLNMETQNIGSAAVMEKMTTSGKLTDGKDTGHTYGFRMDRHNGLKRMYKNGTWGGFASAFHYYPDIPFGIFAFVNWDYNVYDPVRTVESIAQIYLESHMAQKKEAAPAPVKKKPIKMNPSALKAYEGHYRMGPGSYLQIKLKDDNLVVDFAGNIFRLSPVSETEFIIVEFGMPVYITKAADGKIDGFVFQGMKSPKVELVEVNKEQLKAYEGRYVNEDLNTYYDIVLRADNLMLTSLRRREITLTPENPKNFAGRSRILSAIAFKIDDARKIVGFCVDTDSLRSYFFKKMAK
jgi:CubicO group peptidase (beta-lactamase class C family)